MRLQTNNTLLTTVTETNIMSPKTTTTNVEEITRRGNSQSNYKNDDNLKKIFINNKETKDKDGDGDEDEDILRLSSLLINKRQIEMKMERNKSTNKLLLLSIILFVLFILLWSNFDYNDSNSFIIKYANAAPSPNPNPNPLPSFKSWSEYMSPRNKPLDRMEELENLKTEHNCKAKGLLSLCERCARHLRVEHAFEMCCTNTNDTIDFCRKYIEYNP